MLLQIDIYPAAADYGHDAQSLVPAATHYASLATRSSTSTATATGTIWTLGRKEGDFHVRTDKSVSKEHATIKICSSNDQDTTSSSAAAAVAAAPCETPEQWQACETSTDGMCAVFTNLGKLGSYLVVESSIGGDSSNNKKASKDDDDDSDTADEVEVAQSQASIAAVVADVPISDVSRHLLLGEKHEENPAASTKNLRLQHIKGNESIVLHNERSIIQCSKLGTSIVITKIQVQLIPSGSAKTLLNKHPKPLFDAVGCTIAPTLDPTTASTHRVYMVADAYNASLKLLSAWSLGVPIVTPQFVHDLLHGRTFPSDPLPDPAIYVPKSDGNTFWTDTTPDRALFSTHTLLSIHPTLHSDWELLVRSAGVTRVVPLYDPATETPLSEERVTEIVTTLTQGDPSAAGQVFAFSDRRKICQKLLHQKLRVPIFTAKQLAQAITKQQPLLLPPPTAVAGPTGTSADAANVKGSETRTATKTKDAPKAKGAVLDTENGEVVPYTAAKDSHDKEKGDKGKVTKNAATLPKKSADLVEASSGVLDDDHDGDFPAAGNNDDELKMEEPIAEIRKVPGSERVDEKQAGQDRNKKIGRRTRTTESANEKNEPSESRKKRGRGDEDDGDEEGTLHSKRLEFDKSTSGGGWLTALPQGTKRKQYARSREEIMEVTGVEYLMEVAPTDIVPGLIAVTPQPHARPTTKTAVPSNTTTTTPNFKAFRKNPVPAPRSSSSRLSSAPIKMRLVLPKASSEYMRDMELEREEMEKQQRRADELFQ
jgi:hypothetical protein